MQPGAIVKAAVQQLAKLLRLRCGPAHPPALPPALATNSAAVAGAVLTESALTFTLTWPEWLDATVLLIALALAAVYMLWHPSVPLVRVETEGLERCDELPDQANTGNGDMPCSDPATGRSLGFAPALSDAEVVECVARAKAAQKVWAKSSFAQRRRLMRILSRCTLEHATDICRISSRDSGKTTTDAAFGEVLVTLEKLSWLCAEGEAALRPERRSAGRMLFYKRAWVEWHPRGVVGAIVPWNYPFHNVLNPVSAAVFSGNAIVVKVSEHAAWSARFYGAMIQKCLAAAGAPADLVQLVTGYGSAGATLTREVSLMTFVGSTKVGKMVMRGAAETLTPVVLELGGKDPFVLLEGASLDASTIQTAARAGWGAGGQNCIGAERFFVHVSLVEAFVAKLAAVAACMRQGPPLNGRGNTGVDIGAMCLPGEVERIQALVDDAVARGATVAAGGRRATPAGGEDGQFYAPTIVVLPLPPRQTADMMGSMRLLHEEVFGPLITVIPFDTTDALVDLVNGCPFALGSSVFGRSDAAVTAVGRRLDAGMLAANDFATCYMCQSLPMGGLKDSGFGKFAGVEGLRGLCVTKAVVQDALPFVRTQLPPPLRFPLADVAFPFVRGLMHFFYGHSLTDKLRGVALLIKCALADAAAGAKRAKQVAAAAAAGPPPMPPMATDAVAAAAAGSGAATGPATAAGVPAVVTAFNEARLRGDVAACNACCVADLLYVTPSGPIEGLAACEKTFAMKAAPPSRTTVPMQPVAGGVSLGPPGADGRRPRVSKYYRQFEAQAQGKTARIRQEIHVADEATPSGGAAAAAAPKIVKVVISALGD